MKKVLWMLALAGGLLTTSVAVASKATSAGKLEVHDKAGLFTADGIKKAQAKFHDTAFKVPTHFAVVTVSEADVPAARKADYDNAKKSKLAGPFFREWTKEAALTHGKPDVVVLIFSQGDQFFVDAIADRETDVKRHFTDADASNLSKLFQTGMRDAKAKTGDDAKTIRDATLMAATESVIAQLKDTTVSGGATATTNSDQKKSSTGMGIGGWICLGLCVLLGAWVVIALFRALMGGGGGGGGPGGGGGGFMTSFLGGLVGAAAGMWMYNSFFGGSSAMAADGSAASDPSGTGDTGAGDYDGGAGAGGGDFGDSGDGDYGGGDFGGGGGDFGGGDW